MKIGPLRLTPGFLVAVAVGLLLSPSTLFMQFAAAALLHELGHIAALYLCGGSLQHVCLSAIGAEIICNKERLSYLQELFVFAAGPLSNALVGILSAITARMSGFEPLYIFSGTNILLSLFNLLPARQLDGGGALRIVSLLLFDREVILLTLLHYLICAALLALGLWASANGALNLTIIWIAVWMLMQNSHS